MSSWHVGWEFGGTLHHWYLKCSFAQGGCGWIGTHRASHALCGAGTGLSSVDTCMWVQTPPGPGAAVTVRLLVYTWLGLCYQMPIWGGQCTTVRYAVSIHQTTATHITDLGTCVYFVDYLRKILKTINNLFLPPTRLLCCGPSYHSESVQGRQTNTDCNPRGWGQLA